jgi:cysteine-rich repeat protein
MNGYSCTEDALLKSICVPVCGNGRRDQINESCDDFNSLSGDGCSSGCLTEYGYYCSGGSANSKDVFLLKPYAKIVSISTSNLVTVELSQVMK